MALSSSPNARFFGMDVGKWPAQCRAAAALLLRSSWLRGLTPAVRVRLHLADGRTSLWDMAHGQAHAVPQADPASVQADAIELPQADALQRELVLPALPDAQLADAIDLEVGAISPFPRAQTIAGYRAQAIGPDRVRVHLALTSRQQLERLLPGATGANAAVPQPEVWVLSSDQPEAPGDGASATLSPIVLRGFGEAQREGLVRRGRRQRLGLLLLAGALLAALAITPVLRERARAIAATQAFDVLRAEVAPQLAQREALQHRADQHGKLRQQVHDQAAPLLTLELLTRLLPDSAWLHSVQIEGAKVTLSGDADDTAALVQRLSAQQGVHGVRLPSPVTRSPGAAKEAFVIEMELDPAQYGLVRGGVAP